MSSAARLGMAYLRATISNISHNCRVKVYPDGTREYLVCSKDVFREPGYESEFGRAAIRRHNGRREAEGQDMEAGASCELSGEAQARSMRRARARVRALALCTDFAYFVTLTLDRSKVDRYDMAAIVRKLRTWLDNRVRRQGLAYILVPERHKDGAIHFHGFFNGALPAADSGTLRLPERKRPVRPRGQAERERMLAAGGQVVYNLPDWALGFSTAIALYGNYSHAVSYVCKYIGKQGDKPAGRWYYSGGALGSPEVLVGDCDYRAAAERPDGYAFVIEAAGAAFVRLVIRPDEGDRAPGELERSLQFLESKDALPVLLGETRARAEVLAYDRLKMEKGEHGHED